MVPTPLEEARVQPIRARGLERLEGPKAKFDIPRSDRGYKRLDLFLRDPRGPMRRLRPRREEVWEAENKSIKPD